MRKKRFTIALIGPHGAGKTTLGCRLAQHVRCNYDSEIGRELREALLERSPCNNALAAQPEFDLKVINRELERDFASKSSRIVETWHVGNLAYAGERSPNVAKMYEDKIRKVISATENEVLVQPLRIARDAALCRLTEPSDDPNKLIEFFRTTAIQSEKLAKDMGLTILEPIRTDILNEKRSLEVALDNLASHGIIPSDL